MLCAVYYAVQPVVNGVLAYILGVPAPIDPLPHFANLFLTLWLPSMAQCALILFVSTLTRSKAGAIAAAIIFGSGLAASLVGNVLNLFGLSQWLELLPFYSIMAAPTAFSGAVTVRAWLVGLCWTVVFAALSALALRKKDI